MMGDETDPPIHILTEDGKLRICLSRAAKWAAGVAASLFTMMLAGAFGFAWQSNAQLAELNTQLRDFKHDIEQINRRVEKLDDKIDQKADR